MTLSPLLPGYSTPIPAAQGGGIINVQDKAYGAVGNGVVDDYEPIMAAFAAARAAEKNLSFNKGTYYLSKALLFDGANEMTIGSSEGAILMFRSSDASLVADPVYDLDPANKRAGLYMRNSTDCTISSLILVGDDVENDLSINTGNAVSLYKCTRTRMTGCRQFYGAGLITQSNFAEDYGTLVESCYSFASRLNSRLGSDSWFKSCLFEIPLAAKYDRTSGGIGIGLGSSQGIYFFASSGNLSGVEGCTFKNVRVDAIKVSGSSTAKTSFSFVNNIFDRVGLKSDGTSNGGACILYGADDQQFHNHMTIRGLQATDCNAEVTIYGARSVDIDGVHAYHSVAPVSGPKSAFVNVARYPSSGPAAGSMDNQPVEMVDIRNVTLSADPTIGAGNIALTGVAVTNVGDVDSTYDSSVSITSVTVNYAATTAVSSSRCVAPTFDNIKAVGCVAAMALNGDRSPWLGSLHVVRPTSNNAQIKQTNVSWPILAQLYGAGTIGATGNGGKVGIGDNTGSGTPVEYPLCGLTGFAYPSEIHPEIVFALGDDWTPLGTANIGRCANDPTDAAGTITLLVAADNKKFRIGQRFIASPNSNAASPRAGTATVVSKTTTTVTFSGTITSITTNDYLFQAADQVEINGTFLTYVSSGSSSTTFSDAATLMTAIAAISGGSVYTATDYGAYRSPAVTTRHIRVRRVSDTTAFYGRSFCYRPTAGVFLFNSSSAYDRTTSRGGVADQFVIWSPCYKFHAPPMVTPANVPAQTCLSVVPFTTFRAALSAAVLAADSSGTVATFESTLIIAINALTLPGPSVPVRVLPVADSGDQGVSCVMTVAGMVGGAVGTGEEWSWRCG